MAEINKPPYNLLWSSGGVMVSPSDVKIQTGWTAEVPPFQWENWSQNRQDQAIAHVLQHGISVWDELTEYQYTVSGTKSLVMGSNGTIYRAKQVNTNQNPVTDISNVYWEVAFANAGDFYTKSQSDARYLQSANNLSDIPNAATARNNLSVYSQAQTYTKTEVDNKTTVASILQSQQQLLDTVLLTPLKLGYAFQGANQNRSQDGYQKLPGGLIVQWGLSGFVSSGGNLTVILPATFPTAIFTSFTTYSNTTTDNPAGENYIGYIRGVSTGTIVIRNLGPAAAQFNWFAIGH